MKNTVLSFIIDWILLSCFVGILVILMKYTYNHFGWSRNIFALIMFLCIPIIWGTLIFSLQGKRTIGNIIVDKINKKYNDKDTDSK